MFVPFQFLLRSASTLYYDIICKPLLLLLMCFFTRVSNYYISLFNTYISISFQVSLTTYPTVTIYIRTHLFNFIDY